MSAFPANSIRAAVAALGDAWILVHEPTNAEGRNWGMVCELRDRRVMRLCDDMLICPRRLSMLRRASFGMTAREARELIA